MSKYESLEGVQFYTAESCPYGLTYGRWTVEWWRWLLSIPASVSPALDESGKYASLNQPSEDVWFLAGKVGSESHSFLNVTAGFRHLVLSFFP